MDIIKWRESYEIGVSAMDGQHQKLIELINKLYKVMRDKDSQTITKDVLNEMNKYADHHFHEEEKLLKEKNYPEYDSHVALHQSYRDKLKILMEDSEEGEKGQAQKTYTFLRQWWMKHIVGEDKLYGDFVKSKTLD